MDLLECIRRVTLPEYDVFLSHANIDKPMVNLIYKDLLDQEFEVWYDKDNIHGGNKWTKAIQDGIDNSKVLVVVWTENSSKSEWVDREIVWASSKNIPIIPLMMDDAELTISVVTIQHINASMSYFSKFPELISRIQKYVQNEVSEKNSKNFAWLYQKKPFFRSEFLEQNNYLNVRDNNFALNAWTEKLHRRKETDWVQAESVVSFCAVPIPNIVDISLKDIRSILQNYEDLKLQQPWRKLNHKYVSTPKRSDGEFVIYENRRDAVGIEPHAYLRFDENGSFEFADSYNTIFDFEDRNGKNKKGYHLIKILGASWKILNFIVYYYHENEYSGHFQFLVNLRNAKSKMLAGFAQKDSQNGWESGLSKNPFSEYKFKEQGISDSEHSQFIYNVSVEDIIANPELTLDVIIDLSEHIQWAFNLDYKPRHCLPDTEDFHWQSYSNSYYNEFI